MDVRGPSLLLTCEHAGNWVPARYQGLFSSDLGALHTHEGLDLGAADVARRLSRAFGAPLREQRLSRLLIDCNRSLGHKGLFSRFSRTLSEEDKERLRAIHAEHRRHVEREVHALSLEGGPIIHVAVHSFTPVLNGQPRDCDFGLLYDPRRALEKSFCVRWKKAIEESQPMAKVRRNYPYKGHTDGLTTLLRKEFDEQIYVGVELEINQGLLMESEERTLAVTRVLQSSLESLGVLPIGRQRAARAPS